MRGERKSSPLKHGVDLREGRLHQLGERLALTDEPSAIGLAVIDIDGSWVDANPALCRLLGRSRSELLGLTFQDIIHSDDLAADLAEARRLLDGDIEGYEIDKRYLLSDGGEAWVQLNVTLVRDSEGRPQYFITQIQDIADEKNSAAMLDATFEASADMLCVADLNGYFIRVNPAWTHVLGWTSDDLTSRPLIDFVHPQDVESTKAQFVDTAASHSGAVAFENRYLAKDGEYHWLQWSAYTLKDKGWIIANARDVTDQTVLAAELLRSNLELTNVGAVISHDLKSPLTTVAGFAELLRTELLQRGDEELALLADAVVRSAMRMAAMTDGILAHSQVGAFDHDSNTQVDLKELAQAVINDLAAAVKTAHATVEIASPLPSVSGDPVALRQVLQNLVDNALKFGRTDVDLKIAIKASRADGKWMLGVVDNGLGMSESDQQFAFEPFRQGEAGRSRSGVGLGLATCRRLVEHGGGEIVVESNLGEGTAVWFSIPDTAAAEPEEPQRT